MPETDQPRTDIIAVLQRDIKDAHKKADKMRNQIITDPVASPTHIRAGTPQGGINTVANTAYISPIENIYRRTFISKIIYVNAIVAGNMDIGIFWTDDEITFNKLYSTGSVPSATGVISIPVQTIVPVTGRRWSFVMTFNISNQPVFETRMLIGYNIASTFPLPAVITGVTYNVNYPAIIGSY
jgi:hypothetical protein